MINRFGYMAIISGNQKFRAGRELGEQLFPSRAFLVGRRAYGTENLPSVNVAHSLHISSEEEGHGIQSQVYFLPYRLYSK